MYCEPCKERKYTKIQESALEAPESYLIRKFNKKGTGKTNALQSVKFYRDVSKRTLRIIMSKWKPDSCYHYPCALYIKIFILDHTLQSITGLLTRSYANIEMGINLILSQMGEHDLWG